MPELPEVEIIASGLNRMLKGKSFSTVNVIDKKVFQTSKNDIINKKISQVYRRAKLVIFDLQGNDNMVVHLKMTGQFIFVPKSGLKNAIAGGHQSGELCEKVPHKHTRIIFNVKQGGILYYNDLRRFGWIRTIKKEVLKKLIEEEFGPEPFSKEFNLEYFAKTLLSAKKSNIKKVLMDQKKISGIGNMYADEALFLAGIDPRRIAAEVSKQEQEKLYKSIKIVLKKGIKYQGASIKNYLTCQGKKGKAQEYFKVYSRSGASCPCGGKVKKIKLNGRGTHYCPKCQK